MTDLAANALETSAIVKRRLIGLLVLLFMAFLLSLLLRNRPNAPDALPSVIIPLNGSVTSDVGAPTAVPILGAPEPEPEPEPVAKPAARVAEPEQPRATQSTAVKPATAPKPVPPVAKPKPDKPVVAASRKPATPAAAPRPNAPSRWFVAVGAYKDPMAAQAIANRIKLAGFGTGTAAITSAGERLHRVRAGPFGSKADAESARVTLIVEGLTKSVVVSEK
ncbi:MAG: SPOR domain-containing protein [Pseudomonadota bacterium]